MGGSTISPRTENYGQDELGGVDGARSAGVAGRGEITSVELTTAVLERVSQVEDRVKAFVTVTDELAMASGKTG